jgi:putative SOS response-associated peptidase YedK
MCGRYTLKPTGDELTHQFALLKALDWQPRFNLAPTQLAPIITANASGNEARLAMWGLVPAWSQNLSAAPRLINARAETVAQKPAFRQAYRQRRCLVPASGFFEWQASASGKLPWYFQLGSSQTFCFAGLWEEWQPKKNDDPSAAVVSYTILTVAAHGDMAGIHSRMPLILTQESEQAWLNLDIGATDPPASRPEGSLKHHRVSTQVNRVSHEGRQCIQPLRHDDRLF